MATAAAYFLARGMRHLGLARDFADQIHRVIANTPLLEDFTLSEIRALGERMHVYEAAPGQALIVEGEAGDFMVLIVTGTVDVTRRDRTDQPSRIAVVQEGHALGEMSMLDGEPRSATCCAIDVVQFAVLDRVTLATLIQEEPRLGAKILVKLVHMLAQRLRNTSNQLVKLLEATRAL